MADLYAKISECTGAYPELLDISDAALRHKAQVLQVSFIKRTNNHFPSDFPPDVVNGAIKLILYDERIRGKEGIKSESLSRYSVSYDTDNGENGYPSGMLDFLKPYMKARF